MSSASRTLPQPPQASTASPDRWPGGCTVLLAVHPSRRKPLCDLLASAAPGCRPALATGLVDATLQLAQGPVDLLVLDLQLEPEQPLALIHLMARFVPGSRILAFGEAPSALPIQPYRVHGWSAAPSVLSAAIAACRTPSAEARPR